MSEMIRFQNVTYSYAKGTPFEKKALNDVSFSVETGDFFGIYGLSGSGKSTLLRLMAGLAEPSSGQIILKENARVGLVFQFPENQLFGASVIEDVMFGPLNRGLGKDEVREKATRALNQVGISAKLFDRSPFSLSGGEKRRVAIAGVLAMKPKVLILDEPTAGLDPKGRDELLEKLTTIRKDTGCTIILVSHSMEDVARYADRIVVMHKGKIAFDDTPSEVFKHRDELKEMGLGVPNITETMYELKAAGFPVSTDIITVDTAVQEILRAMGK